MRLSYTSLNTYETCPAKYRFSYLEDHPYRAAPALSFGNSLHEALYRWHARPVPVPPPLGELLDTLEAVWISDGYADEAEEQTYYDHGVSVLTQYHADNAPSYRIPATAEQRFAIDVEGVTLTGVIDRMDRLPGGGYEIIDYKTNRKLPPLARVKKDLQLSVYYLAAMELWGIQPEALTLYFLLPGQRLTTTRTPADADELRRRIVTAAERIAAERFEPRDNPLCNWCDFQKICPLYRHRYEGEEGASGEPPAPDMTALVQEWVALSRSHQQTQQRLDELGAQISAFARQNDYGRLFAADGAAIERHPVRVSDPDEEQLRGILEPLGLWDKAVALDAGRLSALVESRTLPPAVEDAVLSASGASREEDELRLKEPYRRR